ncbi:permease-like cell division protein FtsX [Acidaminobacter sp. JC074]|uniref:permease-like cell division protein FtsX n=1 Tax=Acidaminobacter sp. JC074 TaxID=2530199 RepID=UPI001F0E0506|nr:permease-like cell division protein FtsX [Acidaminobacter sp. JC074]
MMIRSFFYVIKQAFVNLWRNRTMTLASVISVAATLLILGVVFILIVNISNLSEYASAQFDSIQVFLEEDLSIDQMNNISDQIEGLESVAGVTFETKEQALEKMKNDWDQYASVLAGLEDRNPLPNSIIVEIDNLIYSDSVVRKMKTIPGIEQINYYRDVIDTINNLTKYVRDLGLGIIAILLFVSTFVINNTIKLAVNARKTEVQIMKYVGATHWFIRWPFILEGTILGLLGAGIASALIYFGYSLTFDALSDNVYILVAQYIIPVSGVMNDLLQVFIPVGAGIGALGSLWGVRRYLNV